MIKAPLPHNEAKRLKALRDLLILDTPPEARFDRISAFAAKEFNVPIALVSLVDQDRQWFKSSFGMDDVQETPRDISFCGHAVAMAKTLIVLDALADPRFADNPMVVGPPYVRTWTPLNMPGFQFTMAWRFDCTRTSGLSLRLCRCP